MAATLEQIRTWVYAGRNQGATHVIVVCDTYDWEDFSVNVSPKQNVHEEETRLDGKNMQKVMEVYWVVPEADLEAQLALPRSWTYGPSLEIK